MQFDWSKQMRETEPEGGYLALWPWLEGDTFNWFTPSGLHRSFAVASVARDEPDLLVFTDSAGRTLSLRPVDMARYAAGAHEHLWPGTPAPSSEAELERMALRSASSCSG